MRGIVKPIFRHNADGAARTALSQCGSTVRRVGRFQSTLRVLVELTPQRRELVRRQGGNRQAGRPGQQEKPAAPAPARRAGASAGAAPTDPAALSWATPAAGQPDPLDQRATCHRCHRRRRCRHCGRRCSQQQRRPTRPARAVSRDPMPVTRSPTPARPPPVIVTNAAAGQGSRAADDPSVPPLTVVPPRVAVRAAEDQLARRR